MKVFVLKKEVDGVTIYQRWSRKSGKKTTTDVNEAKLWYRRSDARAAKNQGWSVEQLEMKLEGKEERQLSLDLLLETRSTSYPMIKFFEYSHLPPKLQEVSAPFGQLAAHLVSKTYRPEQYSFSHENAQATLGFQKLLEAKDCFVRASL